jgi:hypothetical protein
METFREFIEAAKDLKPENDMVFVHVRGTINYDGKVEIGYYAGISGDQIIYCNNPEAAITLFRQSHYPETEPVQTDIKITGA